MASSHAYRAPPRSASAAFDDRATVERCPRPTGPPTPPDRWHHRTVPIHLQRLSMDSTSWLHLGEVRLLVDPWLVGAEVDYARWVLDDGAASLVIAPHGFVPDAATGRSSPRGGRALLCSHRSAGMPRPRSSAVPWHPAHQDSGPW